MYIMDNFRDTQAVVLLVLGLSLAGLAKAQVVAFIPDNYLKKEFKIPVLRTVDNVKIVDADLKGKPTLINFWFTSCKPCLEEMPALNAMKRRFRDSVNFIAITYESKGSVVKFLQKHPFDFVQVAGAKSFTDHLGMRAYPCSIFLNRDGLVEAIDIGLPYHEEAPQDRTRGYEQHFTEILTKLLSE